MIKKVNIDEIKNIPKYKRIKKNLSYAIALNDDKKMMLCKLRTVLLQNNYYNIKIIISIIIILLYINIIITNININISIIINIIIVISIF